MNDYGLFPALPVVFFVALALLVGSIVNVVLRAELSPVRLGLHLAALLLMLHGTMPVVFREPVYPWLYKHVGVVGYINLHGTLDSTVDIYHNWPGFFALAAWFTRIAGADGPLDYAAWAPVYFNGLVCIELAFVFRSFRVSQRTRWLGLFVFVVGNWVGQDYFAPQAAAFLLSLAVFGMVLAWMRDDRRRALPRGVRRLASRAVRSRPQGSDDDIPPSHRPSRLAAVCALFFVFAMVVVTHQLSPYVVVISLGVLTVAGIVRPRWVVVGLAAITTGYLLLRLPYLGRTQNLFGSLGDPFRNLHDSRPDGSVVMTGRRLTALAAPALILCLWTLAALGVVRRLRAGRPVLVLVLLAFSPILIALGQSYGGEAVFRIYLFSLPWIALLCGSALEPSSPGRRLWPVISVGVVLFAAVAMFMSSSFGAAELYVVQSGEVAASRYFYDHAPPGGVLTLVTPNFPTRLGERYDRFRSGGDNPPVLLTEDTGLRHRMLGDGDLPAIGEFVDTFGSGTGGRYLALSASQETYAEVLGLLPTGSLAALDRSLAASPDWQVFFRNRDAVIYRFAPEGTVDTSVARPGRAEVQLPPPRRVSDESADWVPVGSGLVGLLLLGLALRRRRCLHRGERGEGAIVPTVIEPARAERWEAAPPAGDPSRDGHRVPVGAGAHQPEPEQLAALALALAVPDPAVRVEALDALPAAGTSRAAIHVLAAAEDGEEMVRQAAYRRLAEAPSWVLWMALARCTHRLELVTVVTGNEDAASRLAALVLERISSPDEGDRTLALHLAGCLSTAPARAECVRRYAEAEAVVARCDAVPVTAPPDEGNFEGAETLWLEASRQMEAASVEAHRRRLEAEQEIAEARADAKRLLAEAARVLDQSGSETARIASGVADAVAGRTTAEAALRDPPDGHGPSRHVPASPSPAGISEHDDAALLRRLLADDPSPDVRLAAVAALARTSAHDQLAALALALADPDSDVRIGALEALPVTGTVQAAVQVLAAADDRDERVRTAAYRRLAVAPSWVLWMALAGCSHRFELLAVVAEEGDAASRLAALVLARMSSPDGGDWILASQLAGHLERAALLAEAVDRLSQTDGGLEGTAGAEPVEYAPRTSGLIEALAGVSDRSDLVATLGALDPNAEPGRLVVDPTPPHPFSAGEAGQPEAPATDNGHSVVEVWRTWARSARSSRPEQRGLLGPGDSCGGRQDGVGVP